MLFRNAIRLLIENFKSVYKIALYKFVVTLVASALCCALVLPELISIWESPVTLNLREGVGQFFSSLFSADASGLEQAKDTVLESLKKLGELLSSKTLQIVLITIGCVVIYLIKRFVETLCYFTIGDTLNDKMTTYAETPFFTAFVKNLGKASVYALVYVPVVFLFDLVTFALVCFILSYVPIMTALFLSMTLIVMLQALKLTVTGLWMPAMSADNVKLRKALKGNDCAEKKQRWKIYSTYLISVYLIVIVNVISAICTFFSALLITVPLSFMLFICLQYVYYYTVKGKKYFITYEKIASNPDKGDREHFFEYIGETATEEDKETK